MRTLPFKDETKKLIFRNNVSQLVFKDKTKDLTFNAEMDYLLIAPKSYLLSETGKIRI